MTKQMWMVRAGRGGAFAEEFLRTGLVGIGWRDAGDPTQVTDKAVLLRRFAAAYPETKEQSCAVGASIVFRFVRELQVGDDIATYDTSSRTYHVGVICGAAVWSGDPEDYRNTTRKVEWTSSIGRDRLSLTARNTLGAIQTLFKLQPETANELRQVPVQTIVAPFISANTEAEADPFADIAELAIERIKDRIIGLDWEQMQELVAALLRSMGYQTRVSPRGADRGRDIFASPDGFGFGAPRIVTEVKHRPNEAIGAPQVRAMPVGSHADDRGLFVSTGGFTREAYYEAERSNTLKTLMNLDDLARAIIQAYPKFDDRGRALLPLTRIYWPV